MHDSFFIEKLDKKFALYSYLINNQVVGTVINYKKNSTNKKSKDDSYAKIIDWILEEKLETYSDSHKRASKSTGWVHRPLTQLNQACK